MKKKSVLILIEFFICHKELVEHLAGLATVYWNEIGFFDVLKLEKCF